MGIHLILVLYLSLSLSMSRRFEKKVSSYFCSIQSYGCRVELFHPLHVSYGGSMHFLGFQLSRGPLYAFEVPPPSAVPQHPQRTMAGFWLSTGLMASSGPERPKASHVGQIEILRNQSVPMGFLLESHGVLPKSPGKHPG